MTLVSRYDPYEATALARAGLSLELMANAHPPVEYLIGSLEFAGQRFAVSPATLIPRIESEQLVGMVLETIKSKFAHWQQLSILDLGCGSGALGLSVGLQAPSRPKLQFTLADVSPAALQVARHNHRRLWPSHSPHQVRFRRSWLWRQLRFGAPYQIVIANLPYIPTPRLAHLDASVVQHEPTLALDGGPDGLSLIRQFVQQAHHFTSQETLLFLEVDDSHRQPVLQQLAAPHWQVTTLQDFQGKNRFAILSRDRSGGAS